MRRIKGIADVKLYRDMGQPNLNFTVDRDQAARFGINVTAEIPGDQQYFGVERCACGSRRSASSRQMAERHARRVGWSPHSFGLASDSSRLTPDEVRSATCLPKT